MSNTTNPTRTPWVLARRAERMNPSVIREILKVTERPGIISFGGGLPSAKTFPVSEFARACAEVLALPVHDDRLHVEPLFEEDFVLAVPADHELAHGDGTVSMGVLAGQSVLLLEDGHCLRDQALSVCHLAGASERGGFRATSLETLRQMVAAGVGMTLLPELAVQSPVSGVAIRRFEQPRPTRRIAMCWRLSHPARSFFPEIATLFRELPAGLVTPLH